jgi:outer membrane protein assembly factor BamA
LSGRLVERSKERLGPSVVWNFQTASAAFVGDSSLYGFLSPINGTRYRYEVEALRGDLNFQTALADWRRYFFFRPATLAIRGMYYGRHGETEDLNQLSPLYLGRGSLMRGYDPYGISVSECHPPENRPGICPVFDRLVGSQLAYASVELRAPLLGTKEFGLINASFLPTEIYAFGDAGGAWAEDDPITWEFDPDSQERVPVFSAGIGVRILLAYIPVEFFAAKAFQRPDEDIVYGFNIAPGW